MWIWFGLAAVALIGEVGSGTFYLLLVALGLAAGGIAAWLGRTWHGNWWRAAWWRCWGCWRCAAPAC